ncbi:class I SAM-dependent methyltransferase [Allobranchiibius sp. GilTou73]|uniref:class I SAM-dependent methyltransferase n=1 Tax=Allobranchiibius sp. GilTou73 TaxID=2904523 RepID=UPI001F2E6789|nr:class I SAM-dependent methyltransferase [Allobranchiibius sp. GilTou73]UIJ33501.1 class I SAM-dependent methyltransferase [Allobranchiibius sp. GilTou73]
MSHAHPDVQDRANHASYTGADAVRHYPRLSHLHPAEKVLFDAYDADLRGRTVLDIGVGGGRTTGHLAPLAREYVGLDYSPALAAATAARFPDLRIEEGDVRDLRRFDDASFDAVIFSFNGLDYIGHDDRAIALREMRRVLREGGLLLLSSHNRDHLRFHLLPWQGRPRPGRSVLRSSYAAWRARANRRRLRAHEVIRPTWAVINDDAHDYSMLTYYVGADESRNQLRAAGFADIATFDLAGDAVERDDRAVWLYYTGRAA